MDLVAVANACAVECVRQKVGIRELGFLLEAYEWLTNKNPITSRTIDGRGLDWFLVLGSFIEPVKNHHGFRKVPVTFQNGGSSANASDIPRLMEQLVETINDLPNRAPDRVSRKYMILGIVQEFLWIHPFADGNGRCAFLLFNYLLGTLDSPVALPDFGW